MLELTGATNPRRIFIHEEEIGSIQDGIGGTHVRLKRYDLYYFVEESADDIINACGFRVRKVE